MTPFLTAVWSDLILMSYAVPDEMLVPYLPDGITLDRWAGSAWCSLIAFDFTQMRVRGWSVPPWLGVCDFPEFNLRFYVRQGNRRGVVFVRELVPTPLVALAARLTYNEKYSIARMTSRVTTAGTIRRVRHDIVFQETAHVLAVSAQNIPSDPPADDLSDWLKEQQWGFGRTHGGRTLRYHVSHPHWRTYPVDSYDLTVDFESLYGSHWQTLQGRAPDHVTLAEGSHVAIYPDV